MTYKLFSHINCFDDLVEDNLAYLRVPPSNDIDDKVSTPIHSGPLWPESKMIVDSLQNLCRRHRVMTMSSQPAYTRYGRRQRGYVHGVISLPGVSLTSLASALNAVGGLEYCLYRRIDNFRDRLNLERVERVNVLGHCCVSQWRNRLLEPYKNWVTEDVMVSCCGGRGWGERMFSDLKKYEQFTKTILSSDLKTFVQVDVSYLVTEDPSIIVFDVADDSFDLGVSHCCDKLQGALELVKSMAWQDVLLQSW